MARKAAMPFIFITLVLDIVGIGIVVPILPGLLKELQGSTFGTAAVTYGVVAGLYALMQFLFAPLLGALSDRFGRRPVILISLFGSGIDYFVLAWAPTLSWFIVARLISGLTAANFSAATAYIADVSPPEKRAGNFGLIGAAFGLGFIIGPVIGGVLGEIHLRLPFIVSGALTLLNWLYGMFVLPESLDPKNRRAFSWLRSNPIGSLFDLKRYPMVFGLAGVYFLTNLAHQVLPSTWVLYTGFRYNWSYFQVSLSLALVGLMSAIMQGGLTRVVVPKLGERKTALLSFVVSALAFIGYGTAPEGWMIYVIIVFGSLAGLSQPAVQGMISRSVGDDEQGSVQGALSSLVGLTGIIGPLIATGLFGYFISEAAPVKIPGAAFYSGALMTTVAIVLAIRCTRKSAIG